MKKKEKSNSFKYKKGSLLALLIVFSPFLIFVHLLFSEQVNTISLFGYNYNHGYLQDQVFAWLLLKNILPIVLFAIWYFTSKSRIRIFFLLYIGFFTLKVIEVVFRYNWQQQFFFKTFFIIGFLLLLKALDSYFFTRYRRELLTISANKILGRKNISKSFYGRVKSKLSGLENHQAKHPGLDYLKNLFSISFAIKGLLPNEGLPKSAHKLKAKHEVILGGILILTFSLLFLHDLVGSEVQKVDLFIFELRNNGFKDLSTFIWYFMNKAVLTICIGAWFVSCPYWWRYAILSPIILYSYQFWESFQDERYLDAAGNIRAFPLILGLLIIILILSQKLRYRVLLVEISNNLHQEIDKTVATLALETTSSDSRHSENIIEGEEKSQS